MEPGLGLGLGECPLWWLDPDPREASSWERDPGNCGETVLEAERYAGSKSESVDPISVISEAPSSEKYEDTESIEISTR